MVASDYKVRVGRQEFNTKCSFDAAAGFEDLLSRASTFGLDVHRVGFTLGFGLTNPNPNPNPKPKPTPNPSPKQVGFTGSSAGGGEMHYLSWTYRALERNWRRYTPVRVRVRVRV